MKLRNDKLDRRIELVFVALWIVTTLAFFGLLGVVVWAIVGML